jgi:hypothetical protein
MFDPKPFIPFKRTAGPIFFKRVALVFSFYNQPPLDPKRDCVDPLILISRIKKTLSYEEMTKREKVHQPCHPMPPPTICFHCGNRQDFVIDSRAADTICRKCGTVVVSSMMHEGEWVRNFDDDTPSRSQHGKPCDGRFSDAYSMTTIQPGRKKEFYTGRQDLDSFGTTDHCRDVQTRKSVCITDSTSNGEASCYTTPQKNHPVWPGRTYHISPSATAAPICSFEPQEYTFSRGTFRHDGHAYVVKIVDGDCSVSGLNTLYNPSLNNAGLPQNIIHYTAGPKQNPENPSTGFYIPAYIQIHNAPGVPIVYAGSGEIEVEYNGKTYVYPDGFKEGTKLTGVIPPGSTVSKLTVFWRSAAGASPPKHPIVFSNVKIPHNAESVIFALNSQDGGESASGSVHVNIYSDKFP